MKIEEKDYFTLMLLAAIVFAIVAGIVGGTYHYINYNPEYYYMISYAIEGGGFGMVHFTMDEKLDTWNEMQTITNQISEERGVKVVIINYELLGMEPYGKVLNK